MIDLHGVNPKTSPDADPAYVARYVYPRCCAIIHEDACWRDCLIAQPSFQAKSRHPQSNVRPMGGPAWPVRSKAVQVSAIIPTFNYGRFLPEALNSVFDQNVPDLEVIVIDDGSTDDTPEILDSIADPRLKAFRIPNSGISAARNRGLQEASGEFVAFLDADDRWRPGKLQRQITMLLSEPSVGVVFTDFVRFTAAGFLPNQFSFFPELVTVPTRVSALGGGRIITGDAFRELISFGQFPVYLQTMLFRRSLLQDIRFPPGRKVSEDLYVAMRLYEKAQVGYIAEPLVEVRRHGTNSFGTALEKSTWDLRALHRLEKDVLSLEHKRAVRARVGRLHAGTGHYYFWHKQPLKSAQSYLRCLAYPDHRLDALRHLLMLPGTLILKSRPDAA